MNIKTLLCSLAAVTLSFSVSSASAQTPAKTDNPVLKGSQVTESALIDALAIEGPQAASGVTRGFKASKPGQTGGQAAAKPGAGKASLLITFGTNSADLTSESQGSLDTLARALQSDALAGFSFKVEGHADARGDTGRNQQLSQLRAESVAQYLVAKHGLLAERLMPIGKGSTEPLNKDRTDAPENRRVTIVTNRN